HDARRRTRAPRPTRIAAAGAHAMSRGQRLCAALLQVTEPFSIADLRQINDDDPTYLAVRMRDYVNAGWLQRHEPGGAHRWIRWSIVQREPIAARAEGVVTQRTRRPAREVVAPDPNAAAPRLIPGLEHRS